MNSDYKFINIAINLSKKNAGNTNANPSVGCVIVIGNQIIATGATGVGGRPHAEEIALSKIVTKNILQNATIYVSLEPCCHERDGGNCCDKIIKSGIKKVVIAAIDPDPRVNGKSVTKLKEAGIEVTIISMDSVQRINKGFFKSKAFAMPYITVKMACSIDGKIATSSNDSFWISSPESRKFAHYLRLENQAILVGGNTVRNDDPILNIRISGIEESNKYHHKIIISKTLEFFDSKKIFNNQNNIILISSKIHQNSNNKKILDLKNKGVNFILCNEDEDGIILSEALFEINKLGINSILIEGGAKTITSFIKKNLVDEIIVIQSPMIIGKEGKSCIDDLGIEKLKEAYLFEKDHIAEISSDIISYYKKK